MSAPTRICTALLFAGLALPATAQLQAFGGDAPRMATTRIFWDNGPAGMICIQYGQPEWKAEYDDMLEQAKGQQFRLGKDFWTTLNTSIPLQIGSEKVPAGSYYLGIECDKDGGFHLLVLDAAKADKKGLAPFVPGEWKADHRCAMKFGKSDEHREKLTITLAGGDDDPTAMELKIAWGGHQLSAPVKAWIGGAKEAAADKGKKG